MEDLIFAACIFIVTEIQPTRRLFPSKEKAASLVGLLQEPSLELTCDYHHPTGATLAAGGWKAKV